MDGSSDNIKWFETDAYAVVRTSVCTMCLVAMSCLFLSYISKSYLFFKQTFLSSKSHSASQHNLSDDFERFRKLTHLFTLLMISTYIAHALIFTLDSWGVFAKTVGCDARLYLGVGIYHTSKVFLYSVLATRLLMAYNDSIFIGNAKKTAQFAFVFSILFLFYTWTASIMTLKADQVKSSPSLHMKWCVAHHVPTWGLISWFVTDTLLNIVCLVAFLWPLKQLILMSREVSYSYKANNQNSKHHSNAKIDNNSNNKNSEKKDKNRNIMIARRDTCVAAGNSNINTNINNDTITIIEEENKEMEDGDEFPQRYASQTQITQTRTQTHTNTHTSTNTHTVTQSSDLTNHSATITDASTNTNNTNNTTNTNTNRNNKERRESKFERFRKDTSNLTFKIKRNNDKTKKKQDIKQKEKEKEKEKEKQHGKRRKQDPMSRLLQKYTLLTGIALSSTFIGGIIGVNKMGWILLIDDILNVLCLLMMSSYYDQWYKNLCCLCHQCCCERNGLCCYIYHCYIDYKNRKLELIRQHEAAQEAAKNKDQLTLASNTSYNSSNNDRRNTGSNGGDSLSEKRNSTSQSLSLSVGSPVNRRGTAYIGTPQLTALARSNTREKFSMHDIGSNSNFQFTKNTKTSKMDKIIAVDKKNGIVTTVGDDSESQSAGELNMKQKRQMKREKAEKLARESLELQRVATDTVVVHNNMNDNTINISNNNHNNNDDDVDVDVATKREKDKDDDNGKSNDNKTTNDNNDIGLNLGEIDEKNEKNEIRSDEMIEYPDVKKIEDDNDFEQVSPLGMNMGALSFTPSDDSQEDDDDGAIRINVASAVSDNPNNSNGITANKRASGMSLVSIQSILSSPSNGSGIQIGDDISPREIENLQKLGDQRVNRSLQSIQSIASMYYAEEEDE